MRIDGGPAFPVEETVRSESGYVTRVNNHIGMTLRDYFAGQALAGWIAIPTVSPQYAREVAEGCYIFADAMLEARKTLK